MGREEIPPPEIMLCMPMSQSLIEYSRESGMEGRQAARYLRFYTEIVLFAFIYVEITAITLSKMTLRVLCDRS